MLVFKYHASTNILIITKDFLYIDYTVSIDDIYFGITTFDDIIRKEILYYFQLTKVSKNSLQININTDDTKTKTTELTVTNFEIVVPIILVPPTKCPMKLVSKRKPMTAIR